MPTYLAPGVYVEEVSPLARPILGVGTSTAAFIGEMDGITAAHHGKAHFITSFQEFQDRLGPDPAPPATDAPDVAREKLKRHTFKAANRVLSHAVFGFFNNGGRACFVIPLATVPASLQAALDVLEPIDEVAIVAAPGLNSTEQKDELLAHCAKMEDRAAVLDAVKNPVDLTVTSVNGVNITTFDKTNTYGAIYFPWLQIRNPLFKMGSANADEIDEFLTHPPSGHVAGVWARVDSNRGVFKAPANEAILGVVGAERRMTRNQQENLNDLGINVIRAFGGSTIVYGARTLGGRLNSEFLYLSTRRYMNFLKESIDEGTQFVVFEPNSRALWQRVVRSVGDFLYNQWRDGGLFGETPKQAFFVKCDAETNPPSVRDTGQLITEIGVALVKPAEFVIFRIQQTSGA